MLIKGVNAMANFNEHALEMSIMELFKDEEYTYVSGDQIHRERTEVLLTDDLKQYLYNRYAKDGITPSEVDSVILMPVSYTHLDEINRINTDDKENDIIGRVYELSLIHI